MDQDRSTMEEDTEFLLGDTAMETTTMESVVAARTLEEELERTKFSNYMEPSYTDDYLFIKQYNQYIILIYLLIYILISLFSQPIRLNHIQSININVHMIADYSKSSFSR